MANRGTLTRRQRISLPAAALAGSRHGEARQITTSLTSVRVTAHGWRGTRILDRNRKEGTFFPVHHV